MFVSTKRTFPRLSPRSRERRFTNVRANRPAPANSSRDSATCNDISVRPRCQRAPRLIRKDAALDLKRRERVLSARPQRRRHPENDAADDGHSQRETEQPPVRRKIEIERREGVIGHALKESPHAEACQRHARRA